ncbi:MAG: AEC family transporter [Planctomycetota bacterium]|jgi:predicted permease|nr:AEC family transporter [Planctomycetota bacterium]
MHIDLSVTGHAVESVLTFFLIGLIGYVLAGRGWFTADAREMLSKLVTLVALPLYLIHNINSSMTKSELAQLAYGVVPPFISILFMLCLGLAAARFFGVPRLRRGIFCDGIVFSNTMYIGLPINLALFGEKAVPLVLLYYFANTLFFWSVGNYLMAADGDNSGQPILSLDTLKKILTPSMLGFIIGLVLLLLDVRLPAFLDNTARYMGNITTPLVMLSIGITIQRIGFSGIRFDRDMLLMFFGRFVASPASIILVAGFFSLPEMMHKVFIIQAALPMMSTLPILAIFHNIDGEYATVAVSASTLAGLVTIPLSALVANLVV